MTLLDFMNTYNFLSQYFGVSFQILTGRPGFFSLRGLWGTLKGDDLG